MSVEWIKRSLRFLNAHSKVPLFDKSLANNFEHIILGIG